ncbi:MAG: fluoride exporter [Candidatus Hydrogenedentes bacterium]|nr:fluoride exporter [Candidatus Hydrogenedentota bacterium]
MQKLILLGVAGALGALSRYGLAGLVQRNVPGEFPWGTLAVNALGCFVAGAFWTFAEERIAISGETRAIVIAGFLGAFTTFSAYMLETSHLMRDAQWLQAAGNVALENGVCIVMMFAGLALGRIL